MKKELIPLRFETMGVRIVTDERGEPWFCAMDVCRVLGYAKNYREVVRVHCRDVARYEALPSGNRTQDCRMLSEADLYRLTCRSKMEAAKRFERWVFEEVLPTLRRTGSFPGIAEQPSPFRGRLDPGVMTPDAKAEERLVKAMKLTPVAVRAAKALGYARQDAAIRGNEMVLAVTGVDMLERFGGLPSSFRRLGRGI